MDAADARPGTARYRPAGRRDYLGARGGWVGGRSGSRPRASPRMDLGRGEPRGDGERALNDDARLHGGVGGPATVAIATRVPVPVWPANPSRRPVLRRRRPGQFGLVPRSARRRPRKCRRRRPLWPLPLAILSAIVSGVGPIHRGRPSAWGARRWTRSAHLNCDWRTSVATAATTSELPNTHENQRIQEGRSPPWSSRVEQPAAVRQPNVRVSYLLPS